MDKERKTEIVTGYAINKNDSGSTDVQVALLTERINHLTEHLATHRHDFHTQRGLLRLVGRRRRLLAYSNRQDVSHYRKLINRLGLRK